MMLLAALGAAESSPKHAGSRRYVQTSAHEQWGIPREISLSSRVGLQWSQVSGSSTKPPTRGLSLLVRWPTRSVEMLSTTELPGNDIGRLRQLRARPARRRAATTQPHLLGWARRPSTLVHSNVCSLPNS